MWSLLLAPILILSLSFSVAAFTKHTRILSQQVRLLQPRISKWTRVNAAPVAIQNEAKSEIVSPESVQNHIEQIVNVTLLNDELLLHSLRWKPGALELYLFKSGLAEDVSPDLEKLEHFHRHLYTELELIPEISSFLEKCDIVISSPGLSDILSSDKDFVTFQGFTVDVHTSEEFKQTNTTSGTLVKRTADDVVLSQKGKRVSIPRSIIREVRLPPSLKEPGDLL